MPQKKFAIVLTDCPGLPGYFGNVDAIPASSEMLSNSSDKKVISTRAAIGNTATIQVDPVTTPIDAANVQMATGVGVQLLESSEIPRSLSTRQPLGVVLDANTKSITVNLGASDFQTASEVTAGKANALATSTINDQ